MKKAVTIILLAFLVATAIFVYNCFYGSATTSTTKIFIHSCDQKAEKNYQGVILNQVLPLLKVGHRISFKLYAQHINLENRFKAGCYTLSPNMSVIEVARMFVIGEQTPIDLVINDANTIPQLALKISKQIDADSAQVATIFYDKQCREEAGFGADSLFTYIIPNTYQVYWTISAQQLLKRLRKEYTIFWNEQRQQRAKQIGLTQKEVLTLASIVYQETKIKEDMPLIAGVYMNRLKKCMPLQACPTVKFALGQFDLKRVLYEHLKFDSPYNTYINRGLPPSPISIAPIFAIDAVLNYTKSDYLYFCAAPELNGRHNFAKTLAEHNANSRKYSSAINKLKIK